MFFCAIINGMKRRDLTGYRKGRLTVIGFSHSHTQPSGQKRAMWRVACDCGAEKVISTSNLTHGNTVSCGCKLKEGNHKKAFGEATFNYMYRSYENRAKSHKKKLTFNLTKEQFKTLIDQPCFYCKETHSNFRKSKPTANGFYPSNGIDRLDSNLGYVVSNCVPCCKTCNMMKRHLPYDLFIAQVKRIASNAIS